MTSRSDEAPLRVGRYILIASLGEGGMSHVHHARAHAAAGVTKDVCIKRVREERLARPGAVERFIEEARLSMSLVHGNIVPVFDFGRAGEEYYLAMEWIDGADLRAILRDARERAAPLPAEVVAHVGAEVGRALAYAHERPRPVVHRDVKPANVLVSRDGEVKLGDFGVATVVGAGDGSTGGTAAYMAPEQLRGDPADVRADLYSLGVMLREMLAFARDASGDGLARIIDRLVAEDPRDRPRSAREIAAELEQIVASARSSGAPSPRDDLAARADRLADRSGERSTQSALDADASFLRDAPRGEFQDRMGATTATASASIPPEPEPPPVPRDAPASRTARVALSLGVTAVIAAAAFLALREPARPEPDAPRSTAESETRAALEEAPREPTSPTAIATDEPTTPAPSPPEPPRPAPRRPAVSSGRAPAAAIAPAHVNINAVPWAEVSIDGRPAGVTPLFGIELSPGPHRLRLVNPPLGRERETEITVASGDRRDVVIELR